MKSKLKVKGDYLILDMLGTGLPRNIRAPQRPEELGISIKNGSPLPYYFQFIENYVGLGFSARNSL